MRACEFITEGNSVRGGVRSAPQHEFERAHPGLVGPSGHGDMYIGRYYDFYRVSSLAGMDPDEINKVDDISFSVSPLFLGLNEQQQRRLLFHANFSNIEGYQLFQII